MKALLSLTASVAMAALLMPASASAGIVGSAHDFSAETWNSTGEICKVCHTPHGFGNTDHNGNSRGSVGLLWARDTSSATYRMYTEAMASDPNFIGFIDTTQSAEPDGTSKLCLGCHDDTIALADFTNNTDSAGTVNPSTATISQFAGDSDAVIPRFMVGADRELADTHPISVIYDSTKYHHGAQRLAFESATMGSGTIGDMLEGYTGTTGTGKVQCASCHDVHNEEALGDPLLRVDNANSALCRTCHLK